MGVGEMKEIIILTAIASLAASTAQAHAMLDEASPRVGARVSSSPGEITLSFSVRVEAGLSTISLSAEGGDEVALSPVGSGPTGHVLVAKVPRPLDPGRYRVRWSVLSVDGHSTAGDYSFTVGK